MSGRGRWAACAVLALALVGGGALVLAVRPVLIPLGLAVAMAYVIAPAVAFGERHGLRRDRAILLVYAVLALLMTVVVLGLLPAAYREVQRLAQGLPEFLAQGRTWLSALQARYQAAGLPDGMRDGIDGYLLDLERQGNRLAAGAVGGLLGLLEWGLYLVLAPIFAYYILKDLDRLRRAVTWALPRRWRRTTWLLVHRVDGVLAGFVRGQLLLALMVGLLAALAVRLLGLRYALLLGLWAAVAELVPYVGPVVGALPAVLSGMMVSPVRGLQVALAYAIIQQLETAVLGPKILGENVGLHPLAVLCAVLAGGYLAGLPGMVLAVPVAGVLRVVWLFVVQQLAGPRNAPDRTGVAGPAP